MHSFQGKHHTFHFNEDLSGSVYIQNAPINLDEDMVEIDGEDLLNFAQSILVSDIISTLEEKYL